MLLAPNIRLLRAGPVRSSVRPPDRKYMGATKFWWAGVRVTLVLALAVGCASNALGVSGSFASRAEHGSAAPHSSGTLRGQNKQARRQHTKRHQACKRAHPRRLRGRRHANVRPPSCVRARKGHREVKVRKRAVAKRLAAKPPSTTRPMAVPTVAPPAGSSSAAPAPAAASVAPGGPANPYEGRVGLAVSHDLFDASTSEIEAQFAQIHAGGVSWVREDLEWAVAEPQQGIFNWAPFDRLMEAASRTGVHVLGILDYSAPWASSDPSGAGNKFYPPKNDVDYAAYSAGVASRYGSTGIFWSQHPELTPDPLSAVEIWNEPYGSWYWMPGPDPAAYDALVRATAPAIHAIDPSMTVLMSGDLQSWDDRNAATGTQAQPWLPRLLADDPGVAKLVNGLDVHPYPTPRDAGPYDDTASIEQSFGRIPLIRQTELAAGVNLPIWITEVGWSTAPNTPFSVSEQTQASYSLGVVHRAIDEWGAYVPKVFIFGWYRSNGIQGESDQNCGLVDVTGSLKPAWIELTQLLGGAPGPPDPSASLSN